MPTFSEFLAAVSADPLLAVTMFLVIATLFVNGSTDAASAIAEAVGTRSITFQKAAVLAVICMLCVTVASLSCRRRVISFILILVMALLPLGAVGYLSYEIVTDPSLTEIANHPETILELASPEGNYTAVVGRAPHDGDFNTSIILHFNEEPMNFVVGRLQREPLLVHVMNWEDFDLTDLKWIDESTLLCDGNTYAVTAEDVTLVETAEEAAEAIAEEIIPETAEEVIAEAAAAAPSEASTADVVKTPIAEATAEAAAEPVAEASEGTVDQPAEEADAETTAEAVEETAVETELAGAVMG